MPETFAPTLAAAQARIAAVQPDAYARSVHRVSRGPNAAAHLLAIKEAPSS